MCEDASYSKLRHNNNLPPAESPADSRCSIIQALDQEYMRLQRQHETLEELSEQTKQWTREAESAWLTLINPVRDRMFDIAVEIVDIPARSHLDLRTKAKILFELANG
jgi:hypothetical protein